jgi:hypothetical protein
MARENSPFATDVISFPITGRASPFTCGLRNYQAFNIIATALK